ncbi:MAG: hypothetical protein M3P18_05900, partial [Actinomycetota bacterium]|nr:hypothetical protein [Actinomycetota bacterium]
RQEPGALNAHAGICAGGRRQRRSYRDPAALLAPAEGLENRVMANTLPTRRLESSPWLNGTI